MWSRRSRSRTVPARTESSSPTLAARSRCFGDHLCVPGTHLVSARQGRKRGWKGTVAVVAEGHSAADASSEKARRREADAFVAAYHQQELRALLEHVREGFARLDAGDIDEFQLDDLIHRYKRAAKNLWVFCQAGGSRSVQIAAAIAAMRGRGETRDWWAESDRPQHHS